MIRYVGCDWTRGQLDAFADGELPIGDQVLVESHLRWCDTCAARLEDLHTIGASLRSGARASGIGAPSVPVVRDGASLSATDGVGHELAAMQAEVLAQIDTEYEQSLAVRVEEIFADMRLWWPALGATVAVVLSLGLAGGVWNATSADQPTSLAAMIENLSDPGSNRNPLRLDNTMYLPRVLDGGDALDAVMASPADGHADDVVAVAAVLTREGTIGGYELLDDASHDTPAVGAGKAVGERVLDTVRQSRFAPAQRAGGGVVAVNMVWLFARTTVKPSQETLDLGRPLTRPGTPPAATKPAALPTDGARGPAGPPQDPRLPAPSESAA